jgi:hypothetical protein
MSNGQSLFLMPYSSKTMQLAYPLNKYKSTIIATMYNSKTLIPFWNEFIKKSMLQISQQILLPNNYHLWLYLVQEYL